MKGQIDPTTVKKPSLSLKRRLRSLSNEVGGVRKMPHDTTAMEMNLNPYKV